MFGVSLKMQPLVLIHCKDPDFYFLFGHILDAAGFRSEIAGDVEQVSAIMGERKVLAVILDCQDNSSSNASFCAKLKTNEATRDIPVAALMMPQAQGSHLGLIEAGVDETFLRPFAPLKLLDYLRSLRDGDGNLNIGASGRRNLTWGGIELRSDSHRVYYGGREVPLPRIEFWLLRHLMESPDRVFSRENLIKAAWPDDREADPRSVDVHIGRLRKALRQVSGKDMIRTVRGAGYALAPLPT